MLHRVIGLGSLLLACLAGCAHHGHRGCGCHKHGYSPGDSANLNAECGEGGLCTCAVPPHPGDQHCRRHCRKHKRQRAVQRMATAFRRSSPHWLSGPRADECECGCCGDEMYPGAQMTDSAMMWEQNMYAQPAWESQQFCGCDSCATSMTNDWSAGNWTYDSVDQSSGSCGCGEQYPASSLMHIPNDNGLYEYPAESAPMSMPSHDQSRDELRTFPPSSSHGDPATPSQGSPEPAPIAPSSRNSVPMPQDMTPMEFPENVPNGFDPADERAPAPDRILDPVSYEIPRLPPIPERANSSVKRIGPHQVRPI